MATIIICPECGKQQSSEVMVCLHCKAFISSDVKCKVCGKQVLYNEVFRPDTSSYDCYHAKCIEAVLAELVCPLCGHAFTFEEQKHFISYYIHGVSLSGNCPNCGHRQDLRQCEGCPLVITSENATVDGSRTISPTVEYDYAKPYQVNIYRHNYCYAIAEQERTQQRAKKDSLKQFEEVEKQRQMAIESRRRSEKRCTVCGKTLGTMDRMAFRSYHKNCGNSLPNYDE